MAITVINTTAYTMTFVTDGISNMATFDFREFIDQDETISNKVPMSIYGISILGTGAFSSSNSGTQVNITWTSAPPATVHNISVQFAFLTP